MKFTRRRLKDIGKPLKVRISFSVFPLTMQQFLNFFTMNETLPIDSGAPAALGRHAETYNYRTQPTCRPRIMVCSGN